MLNGGHFPFTIQHSPFLFSGAHLCFAERSMKRLRPPAPDLLEFLAPFDAKIAELALAMRAKVIAVAPAANETDWDAYNAVSIGFHYSPKWQDGSFCHIAVYAKHVN